MQNFEQGYLERLTALQDADLSTTTPDTVWDTAFVYCGSHLRAHGTGWCTTYNTDKVPLAASTAAEATAEARGRGLYIYGDPRPCVRCGKAVTDASPSAGHGTYADAEGATRCYPERPRSPLHDPRR